MKRKLLITLLIAAILTVALAVSISAATYYCDENGNLVDATSENIAYEYDLNGSTLPNVYLHKADLEKIVIPDMEAFVGTVQLQSGYSASLGVYMIDDKEMKQTSLISQIKEVEIHENISIDGAYSVGAFAGYTSLEKISFYKKVSCAWKGGFLNGCNIKELHFYGTEISVPSVLIRELKSGNEVTIVFHKGSSGTIATGGETLPTVGKLNNWKIIINENIKPSNESDARLGTKWGNVASTTGWELILAVDDLSAYTSSELEALKTSHSFISRAQAVEGAEIKAATVTAYCALGYDIHNNSTVIKYENGFASAGVKIDGCSRCNIGTAEELSPLFTSLGYTCAEYGTGGVSIGYKANKEAIARYEELTGETVSFGIFAALEDTLGKNDIFDENGNTHHGVISADMTSTDYSIFKIKMVGFTAEQASISFTMGAYVKTTHENTAKYSYLQIAEPTEGKKYYYASYNDILNLK